jgi:hypothetical protein
MEIDEGLLADPIRCTKKLETALAKLDPPAGGQDQAASVSGNFVFPSPLNP